MEEAVWGQAFKDGSAEKRSRGEGRVLWAMGLAGASALRGMKVRTQGVTWAGGHKCKEMEDTAPHKLRCTSSLSAGHVRYEPKQFVGRHKALS